MTPAGRGPFGLGALNDLLGEPGAGGLVGGRFCLEREAAVGGMGVVYRARDEVAGCPVALKLLRRFDEASARRFVAEAAALERVEHPAVVRYLAHGTSDEGEPFLAMEWLEGESLRARLERGPLSVAEAIALGRRLCGALSALHAAGLVHRDLKPGNVMLEGASLEGAKLVDFGIARAANDPFVTTTGIIVGTPGYMAPEQARGARDLDGRADLFSLGCLLYRCLTGAEPFEGAEALTVLAKLLLEEPPRPSERRPEVPPSLDALIVRLMAKDPARRPATAAEVATGLERASDEARAAPPRERPGPELATAPGRPEGGDTTARQAPGALVTAKTSGATRPTRARTARLGAGVGVGLLAAAAVAGLALKRPFARHAGGAPSASVASINLSVASITDLPPSPRCAPEAAASYRQGLQALRRASWGKASVAFAKAAELDPSCPEAQLRLLQAHVSNDETEPAREQSRRVLASREQLSGRDRVLLDALMKLIFPDASGASEAWQTLEEGARRFSQDAELFFLAAYNKSRAVDRRDQIESVLELARRASELDPDYADAWQMQAIVLRRLGRGEESIAALGHCLRAAPESADCQEERVSLLREHGRCDEAVVEARHLLGWAPEIVLLPYDLAATLSAQGAPREAIDEALQLYRSRLKPAERERERVREDVQLAMWGGDFEGALRNVKKLESLVASSTSAEWRVHPTLLAADALVESGRGAQAAARVEQILRRAPAWNLGGTRSVRTSTFEPLLLSILLRNGRLSPGAWREASERWEREAGAKFSPLERWSLRWGAVAGRGIDAAEAWQNLPQVDPQQALHSQVGLSQWGVLAAYEGQLHLAHGDAARAAALLETVARACNGFASPFMGTRASLLLGKAREQLGDQAAACAAYEIVLTRWGRAKPRSVTAEEAARRKKALGCRG